MARIYGLFHPSTSALFYIGRTTAPLYMRRQQHISFARKGKSQCDRAQAIRDILAQGLHPEIGLIEEVPDEQAAEYEGMWIEYFSYIGCLLTNEQSHLVGGTRSYILGLTEERVQQLGKRSDSELALEWGVDRKTVEYHRKVRSIPRKPQTNFVIPPMGGWNKIDLPQDILDQLGTMGDRRLGKIFGVSKEVVMRERNRRGIPSYSEMNNHPTRFQAGQGNWRTKKK